MFKRVMKCFALCLAAVALAGCQGPQPDPVAPPESVPPADTVRPEPPPPEPPPEPPAFDSNLQPYYPGDANRLLERVFYFDFDNAIVKPADLSVLDVHAQVLRNNPERQVVIEGHCDERGTREYNLALGERRANAVSSFLIAAGVPASRIESVSYGEERPDDPGHTEAAWSRNRRAVLIYR